MDNKALAASALYIPPSEHNKHTTVSFSVAFTYGEGCTRDDYLPVEEKLDPLGDELINCALGIMREQVVHHTQLLGAKVTLLEHVSLIEVTITGSIVTEEECENCGGEN